MQKYDVITIGAGPGGYVAAIRASQLGLKTAIVEKKWLGGVCLNVGCIPSKALLKNAEVARLVREDAKKFGLDFKELKLDYSAAVKRSRQISSRLTKGVGFLMKKNSIDVFEGSATFKTNDSLEVTLNQGEKVELTAKNIILATGATPIVPQPWNFDGEKIVTYTEAILQEKLPSSVVIIGAGAIGVEFATIWSSYGTEVTLVEMLPTLVPLEDEEISKELEKNFKRRKIKSLINHRVESITPTDSGVKVTVSSEGEEKYIEAEQALVAIGFKPNTSNLGLEKIGLSLDEKGFVQINDQMQTNVSGIYAIGDVTGKLLLAHAASAMGILCAEKIKGEDVAPINFKMIPSATYCHPQIASFGMTEKEVKDSGKEYSIGKFPFQPNGKALGLGESDGFVKIIVDPKFGEILGAHLIGPEVSELIGELTLAQASELTINEVANNIHSHPTLSEAIMEAAEQALGRAIHI